MLATARRGLQPVSRRLRRLLDRRIARHVGGDRRPAFYDVGAVCPALARLEENWQAIRDELDRARRQVRRIPRYHEADPAQLVSSQDALAWRTFYVHVAAHPEQPNADLFPLTARLVRAVPGVLAAFFSILEPGKSVPRHRAPMMAHLRYHLGLHVPALDPPRLLVADREYAWQEGRGALWDDTLPHAVENTCKQERTVLIVDVLRPLPRTLDALNRACVKLAQLCVSTEQLQQAADRRRVTRAASVGPRVGRPLDSPADLSVDR